MLVFAVLMRLSSGQIDKPILSLVLTLLLATTLYLAVDRPIEKIRQRISHHRREEQAPAPAASATPIETLVSCR
jgi:hypothetical protein